MVTLRHHCNADLGLTQIKDQDALSQDPMSQNPLSQDPLGQESDSTEDDDLLRTWMTKSQTVLRFWLKRCFCSSAEPIRLCFQQRLVVISSVVTLVIL